MAMLVRKGFAGCGMCETIYPGGDNSQAQGLTASIQLAPSTIPTIVPLTNAPPLAEPAHWPWWAWVLAGVVIAKLLD